MKSGFPNESPEYRRAREQLLEQEIALRRHMEQVARARRTLPPGGEIPEDYRFEELNRQDEIEARKLSELFAPGTGTLVVYQFMFPRMPSDTRMQPNSGALRDVPREEGPCPSCTALLDQLDGAVPHVVATHINFVVVAKAPIRRVQAFANDRGWRHLRLLSAAGNSFKRDYQGEDEHGGQMPMLNVFRRDTDGRIRHFWSAEMLYAPTDPGQDPRHNGTLEPLWNLLDCTPAGRPDFDEQLDYCCH